MAQVTIRINGYAYTLVCEDGQEQHLIAMSEEVEKRIESIKATGSGQQTGEAKLLVLASLLMADELHDIRVEQAQNPRPKTAGKSERESQRLAKLAARAEDIATDVEQS